MKGAIAASRPLHACAWLLKTYQISWYVSDVMKLDGGRTIILA